MRPLSILLIDDEPNLLRAYGRYLGRQHEVTRARGGAAGLEVLATGRGFDVVFCDVSMPEVDGPAVHRFVLAERAELAGRFVFMSGGAWSPDMQSYVDRCDCRTLDKPVALSTFDQLIRDLCPDDRRRAGAPAAAS